jgi:cell wall-associated NlpC family hydrolase
MADYRAMTRRAAQKYGLDPSIFERQINQESGFNPNARSPAGAAGIAQIMPATARGWGVDPMNPRQALDAAAKNMAGYVRQYGGYENALRAYNAGPGAIERSKSFPETNHYVATILGGAKAAAKKPTRPASHTAPSRTTGSVDTTRTTTTTTPGVNNRAARASLVSAFLDQKSADPVSFALRARELRDIAPTSSTESETEHTPGTEPRRSASSDGSSPSSGGDLASFAKLRADAINAQGLPYKWGGGHGGQTKLSEPVPLDCSGAVSKVLGIDPRVADQFKTWGRPGDGGSKGVTVYSKPTHTLMKINGHFFGTSGSNPGGGAGWIPQENVSSEYLAGFTARHSDR